MLSNVWTSTQTAHPRRAGAASEIRPVRVLLLDLLPAVPYYTGHLSAALGYMEGVDLTVAASTYTHDHGFFQRIGVRNNPGFLDVAYRIRIATLRRPSKLLECLLNMAALALRFLKSKPDVIHVQFTPLIEHRLPFELWFLKLARYLGISLVYTVHNVLPNGASTRQFSAYRRLYQFVDQLICHDVNALARLANEFGMEPARVSVVPHGPLFTRGGNEKPGSTLSPRSSSKDCMVLCHGIVRPYKGIPFLLRVWKAACDAGLQGKLWIVGTGDKSLLKRITEDAASLGISESVHFEFRFVSVQELATYLETADILVYPYSQITTSGALMTGVGYAKPIVASTLPAFQHVLRHDMNALLVPYGDVTAWASALLRLTSDPGLRTRLGRGLEEKAVVASWAEIAAETRRVYEQLLSEEVVPQSRCEVTGERM